jgi:hypothetical protein
MVGEHVLVVLEVLADLGCWFGFQPGLQARQRFVAGQLRRRAGVVMGERQVGRLARRDRQREADEASGEGIEAGRFGIERGQRTALDLLQPALEGGPVEDRLVGRAVRAVGQQDPAGGGRRAAPRRRSAAASPRPALP